MKSLSKYITEEFSKNSYTEFEYQMSPFDGYFDTLNAGFFFKKFKTLVDKLSSEEISDIDKYRDLHYQRFNDALRKGKLTDEELVQIDKTLKSVLKTIKCPHDIVVWRGISNSSVASKIMKTKVGGTITDKAYTSTSLNPFIADKFIDGKKGVKMKILVPKGTPILPMQILGSPSTITMYDDEFEILLKSNQKLKLIEVGSTLTFKIA